MGLLDIAAGEFLGNDTAPPSDILVQPPTSHVNSRDIKLNYLYTRYTKTKSMEDLVALEKELEYREFTNAVFEKFDSIFNIAGEKSEPENFDCLRGAVEIYKNYCGEIGDYGLNYIQNLVNACEAGHSIDQIENTLSAVCYQAQLE